MKYEKSSTTLMAPDQKSISIVTHSGGFHTDEVFACATLSLLFADRPLDIVRSRDEAIIDAADIVVDVGGKYDPEKKRFDHHQKEGAGLHEHGIPYASFGLIWKEYGEELCKSREVANSIEEHLVLPIDAGDNGVDLYTLNEKGVRPFLLQNVISKFLPTWKEQPDQDMDERFIEALNLAIKILEREIIVAKDATLGAEAVATIYESSDDKQIILLPLSYPWAETLIRYPEPLLVIAPRSDGKWKVETVPETLGTFKRRVSLPLSWAGKRDQELAMVTGVKGAIFCHVNLYLCVAETKEDALDLARIALQSDAK